jgi:hypothetical protein
MTESQPIAALELGDTISASITVRGQRVTESSGLALASAPLDDWQRSQDYRLQEGWAFEPSTTFADKPQGEYSVTRTLKVIEAAQ